MYATLWQFSPEERYESGRYVKGSVNKAAAGSLIGALVLVKAVDIVHALLLRDSIDNGVMLKETIEPAMRWHENGESVYGLQYALRF